MQVRSPVHQDNSTETAPSGVSGGGLPPRQASSFASRHHNSYPNTVSSGMLDGAAAMEVQGLHAVDAIRLGIAYQNQGQNDRAQAIYQHVLNAEPDNAQALHLMAELALQVNNPELAMSLLARAIYVDPTRSAYFRTMAKAMTAMGETDAARACNEKANQCEPTVLPRYDHHLGRLVRPAVASEAESSNMVVLVIGIFILIVAVAAFIII